MQSAKFDMSRTWIEALALIRANREVLATLAGIFFFLPGLLFAFVGPRLDTILAGFGPDQIEPMMAAINAVYSQYWWLFLIVILCQMLGYLTLLTLLRTRARPTVGEAIAEALRALLPAMGAYLVFVLGVSLVLAFVIGLSGATGVDALAGLALLACGPLVMYLVVKVSMAAPVIAFEGARNPLAILHRSWALTGGNALRLCAYFVLLFVAYAVISATLGILLMALVTALGDEAGHIITSIFSGLIGAIASVVLMASLGAAHRQLAGPGSSGSGSGSGSSFGGETGE